MPEHPLLILPQAEPSSKPKGGSGGGQIPPLEARRQSQRMGPKFDRLRQALASTQSAMALRDDPASIAPERAIVFEIAGSIGDFYAAVQRVDGLEFLADEEFAFEPDEDFAHIDTRVDRVGERRMDKIVGGRLYLAMPDIAALRQLLRLWDRWQRGEPMRRGFAPWRGIFEQLKTLRPWGPADRIPDETIAYWREQSERAPAEPIRTEVELWFHHSPERRQAAFARFQAIVDESGGQIVDHAVIESIGYDGALADLPAAEIQRLSDREEVRLAICDDVMFLRPQATAEFPVDAEQVDAGPLPIETPMQQQPPIAALLDGVPVQGHVLLDGRLLIDDPDDLESLSVVNERTHGTQMASLILHGDRNRDEPPLSRQLYVRPVLYAPGNGLREQPQNDKLLIDVIYRAVRRMKEGDDEGAATAPNVFLVNLSLGDENRPFSGPMSPWAKLLDFLSEQYNILFLVSAGNVREFLTVPGFETWTEFEEADPEQREEALLKALTNQQARRSLLSPAEALNPITVGGWHEDSVNNPPPMANAIDPFADGGLPNISSAMGLGHRRVVKPDVHLPAGRELVTFQASGDELIIRPAMPGQRFGLKAALPDVAGVLDREGLIAGTSAATALATRAAHQLFDALMDEAGGSLHADMDPAFYAIVVKALLVHRARWGDKGTQLDQLYGPHGVGKHVERRDNVARVLGYGRPLIEEALSCAPHRATLVGHGEVTNDGANMHRIPLPPCLESVKEPKAVTVTLAWFSPVNPRHQSYRRAKLEAGAVTGLPVSFGVKRLAEQPSDKSVPRGTLFHTHYEGDEAVGFIDDGHVLLRVWCREQAGRLDQSIRYGLAVTIEAGEAIPVYEEIRTRLGVPVVAGAGT